MAGGTIEACTLRDQFLEFHQQNPNVYTELVLLARRAKRAGYRPGIGGLFEVLRWRHGLATKGDPFKLNNNHRAHYARMIMAREADLAGFFELRELRSI